MQINSRFSSTLFTGQNSDSVHYPRPYPPLLWINHIWCACASLCRVNCTRSVQIVFFNLDERAHSEIMSSDKVSQIGINHLYFTA